MATQKDYILVAGALRKAAEKAAESISVIDPESVDYAIEQVCDALEAQHKGSYKFKRSVFLSAAGHSDPCTCANHTHES